MLYHFQRIIFTWQFNEGFNTLIKYASKICVLKGVVERLLIMLKNKLLMIEGLWKISALSNFAIRLILFCVSISSRFFKIICSKARNVFVNETTQILNFFFIVTYGLYLALISGNYILIFSLKKFLIYKQKTLYTISIFLR